MLDRRSMERFQMELIAWARVVQEDYVGPEREIWICDISSRGAFLIWHEAQIPVGTRIHLRVRLNGERLRDDYGIKRGGWVEADGTVVRVSEEGIAVAFDRTPEFGSAADMAGGAPEDRGAASSPQMHLFD